jgi:PAS domain S-box-containing protein
MHASVVTTDMHGIITGSNRTTHRIFGYRADELLGKSVGIFYAEEDRHLIYEQVLPTVVRTGEYQGELRNRTSSGDYIYVHLSVALLRGDDGAPVGMVGFSVDVTSQKLGDLALKHGDNLEQKLEAQRANAGFLTTLERAVERSNDVIVITEAEPVDEPGPRIVYVNPAFERIGKTPRILQGPKTNRAASDRIHKALKSWQPVREEMVNYRKDGSEFCVELSIVPVADERGWYTHWFAIQRDMTEQFKLRDELRKSDVLLRTLTESVPQLLWTADADGRREWVSERFAEFVGAKAKDCLADGWVRYVHPEDRELALARLQEDRQHRRVCTTELRLRSRDGEYVWFMKQAAPRYAADGSVSKWIGSFTNISERKAAESALQGSEQRLRLGMSVAKLALADIDYTTGISHLSPEAARMFGLGHGPVSVTRDVVHATFHPEDRQELQSRIDACLNPRGPGWFEMDHRVVWPDGEVRWLRVRKQVFFEWEGLERRPVRAMLAAFDITEPKEAEATIRRSERRFRDLAESLPQFVWVTDSEGRKTYCNQRYLDYTGIPTCELMDMKWHTCVHPEDRAAAAEGWKLAVKTKTAYMQEYRLRRHDGEYRHFLARGIPVRNELGDIERWLGSTTDVHERKLAEETLRRTEKLSVVGRMASSISHEINNPLTGAMNLLYLMETNPSIDGELRELLLGAQEQLARVTELTKQTLLFHRQSTVASEVKLSETIDSLVALHRATLDAKAVQVMRSDRRTEPLTGMAGEIRQALAHVMSNAVEALQFRGRLVVRVRESRAWAGAERLGVRITVADTGRGIAAENLPKIFDAFFTTKGLNGTGLGLWVTKDIVERHEGFVRVKSTVADGASGTVFQMFLPYRRRVID